MIDGPAALAGPPAGAVGSGLRPRTRPMPAAPEGRDQAGPLPPARYPAAAAGPAAGAAAAGAVPAARAPAGRQASTEAQVRYRGLLALLAMAVAAAASVLLPVAGPAVALVMIVLLRAADRAHGRLSRRRSLRGARASDVPVLLATAPWALVRALASSVLLAPLALACGAAAAAVTILAAHGLPYRAAAGYGAGAFIAFYGFGLGSAKPRRQLGRLFGPVARRRLSAALTAVLLLVLAVAVAAAAVTQPHQIWPLSPRLTWQMPGLRHLTAQLAHGLHHL